VGIHAEATDLVLQVKSSEGIIPDLKLVLHVRRLEGILPEATDLVLQAKSSEDIILDLKRVLQVRPNVGIHAEVTDLVLEAKSSRLAHGSEARAEVQALLSFTISLIYFDFFNKFIVSFNILVLFLILFFSIRNILCCLLKRESLSTLSTHWAHTNV
jgi:hypothetical protein